MLIAVAIDADGGQQHQVLIDVDAVNLDDQQVQIGQVGRHPSFHALRRQRHEPARYRRLGHPRSLRRGHVALRQADGAAELARRDVDQHQVERPLAQQVLRQRRLPARQGDLVAVAGTHAGPLDLDLAAMEADLPRGLAPAVPVPSVSAAVAGTAHPGRILLQHAGQSRKAGRQAEALEARSNLLPGIFDDCRRDNSSRCGRFLHGVAFLSLDSAPRAYRLKASNAYFTFSTETGTFPITLREIKILETDRRQIKSEIRILNEQIQIVKKEIGILVLHRKSVGKSVKTLESEVARQRTLVGKGLARRLTIMTVDSRLSDMRGEYRRTSVSLMRSKTHLSEIEKSILTAKNQREKDIETALVATESVIDVINNKLRHQRSILANQLGGPAGSDDTSGNAIVIGYSIVRDSSDGGKQELTVEDTTPLKPGDILKVRLSSVTRGLGGMDTSNLQTGARSSACESNGSATSTDSECGPRATRARADTGSTKLNMGVANVR